MALNKRPVVFTGRFFIGVWVWVNALRVCGDVCGGRYFVYKRPVSRYRTLVQPMLYRQQVAI